MAPCAGLTWVRSLDGKMLGAQERRSFLTAHSPKDDSLILRTELLGRDERSTIWVLSRQKLRASETLGRRAG